MTTPHKHAKVIKAWADGKAVQVRCTGFGGSEWKDIASDADELNWYTDVDYRIKPSEPVYEYQVIFESSYNKDKHYLSGEFWNSLVQFHDAFPKNTIVGLYHPTRRKKN